MPTVTVNGIELYYEAHGSGPPLLLIMGLGSDSSHWFHQVPEFSRRYQVIALDNRGVGRSSVPPGPYTTEIFGEDAAALLRALNLGSVHVVGCSMGGFAAQYLAAQNPELVASLVLACTGPKALPYGQRVLETWEESARAKGMEGLIKEVMLWYFTPSFFLNRKEELSRIEAMYRDRPQRLEGYISQNRACRTHDATAVLGKIKCPTLVMVGSEDRITPPAASEALTRAIPDAQLVVLPGASHRFMWEIPEAFNQRVLSFLDSVAGSPGS
ncbi:MAG: alpha/beta fold hydrolase [Nitrospinota bacterium]